MSELSTPADFAGSVHEKYQNTTLCWNNWFQRYFPIIVFENLRWSWNLGQIYFVFGVPLQLNKKCNTQCCAQKSNDCEMHCRRSNTSKETDFLLCVVALIRISTFTFHGLMNFCTHASLQLLVVVLQVPTLKASLILPSLVKSKSRLETFAVIQDLPWKNETEK